MEEAHGLEIKSKIDEIKKNEEKYQNEIEIINEKNSAMFESNIKSLKEKLKNEAESRANNILRETIEKFTEQAVEKERLQMIENEQKIKERIRQKTSALEEELENKIKILQSIENSNSELQKQNKKLTEEHGENIAMIESLNQKILAVKQDFGLRLENVLAKDRKLEDENIVLKNDLQNSIEERKKIVNQFQSQLKSAEIRIKDLEDVICNT
ncbi:MAG: hypothetical protein MHPSP_000487 [Paramarteilia canceri]